VAAAILGAGIQVSSIIEELHEVFLSALIALIAVRGAKYGKPALGRLSSIRFDRGRRNRETGTVVRQSRNLSDLVELAAACGNAAPMTGLSDVLQLRVRYSETDQMGTFYNSRALEWFECGRTELMRRNLGMSYAALEARGIFLPLVEAHLEFQGGARYDDLLEIASTVDVSGRAKLRFDVQIHHGESRKAVVRGYTVHAFTDRQGKPIRPAAWFIEMLAKAAADAGAARP
jgi:acyl-CoA thioester hydrolase